MRQHELNLLRLRWLAGQGCVLLALMGAFSVPLGAELLALFAVAVTSIVTVFPRLTALWPSALLRLLPWLLLAVIVVDFVRAAGDIIPPLFRMILLLLTLRAVQGRSPREERQLLLLALFLILVTGVLSHDLLFAVQMLLFAPLAMLSLVLLTLSDGVTTSPHWKGFRWGAMISVAMGMVDRRTLLFGAGLYAVLVGATALLFITMPRFDIGRSLPFPRLQGGSSMVGFSDRVEFGDLVDILDDAAIAMRVDLDVDRPAERPYWRMVVLDGYARGGFSASPGVLASARAFQGNLLAGRARAESTAGDWTLYVEGGISPYIPLVGEFARMRFNSRMAFEEHEYTRVIRLKEVQANVLSVRLEAVTTTAIQPMVERDLALVGKQPVWLDTSRTGYLAETGYPLTTLVLPAGEANREIINAALAQAAIAEDMTIDERVERLVEVLQRGRGYSLSVRIPDGDAETVLRWLDTPDAGHCELYAGAFILLARAAGIPARMVTGFAGGDWNGFENYFMVRNRHAHAWVEVFDPQRGWMTVDPTPAIGTAGTAATTGAATSAFFADVSFGARLDSLRVLWYRRVIQFESADQEALAASVRDAGTRLWMQFSSALRASTEWLRAVFRHGTDTESDSTLSWRWLPWLVASALATLLIALYVAIMRLSRRRRIRSRAASLLRHARRCGIRVDLLTDEWAAGLLCICYGETKQWPPMPSQTIRQATSALRQLRRTTGNRHPSSPWRT